MKTRMGNSSIGDSLIDGSDGWHILLSGIVGSTAYGLAGPESDVDRLGFAAAPTVAFHGLHPPIGKAATREQHEPDDRVMHEAGKAAGLLLKTNPTVTELLWLPDDLYEVRTELGDDLISIRTAFLSAQSVRNAYLGYVGSQIKRLKNRADGTFSSDTRNRTAKHGRHCLRLVHQCQSLYLTGHLEVRLHSPHIYFEFGQRFVDDPEQAIEVAEHTLNVTAMALDSKRSALPDKPNERVVEDWLRRVRRAHYAGPEVAA